MHDCKGIAYHKRQVCHANALPNAAGSGGSELVLSLLLGAESLKAVCRACWLVCGTQLTGLGQMACCVYMCTVVECIRIVDKGHSVAHRLSTSPSQQLS